MAYILTFMVVRVEQKTITRKINNSFFLYEWTVPVYLDMDKKNQILVVFCSFRFTVHNYRQRVHTEVSQVYCQMDRFSGDCLSAGYIVLQGVEFKSTIDPDLTLFCFSSSLLS